MANSRIVVTIQRTRPVYSPPTTDQMRRLGQALIDFIRDRTRRGYDEDGRTFKPYSPAYARIKGTTRPDLTKSGAMLDRLMVLNSSPKQVIIGWRSLELYDRAGYMQRGYGKRPARRFMGVPATRVSEIRKSIGIFGRQGVKA